MIKLSDSFKESFPFISVVQYGGKEYIGIIINQDQYVTSLYNFELLRTDDDRRLFLQLGEEWWWESSRKIPISIFLRLDMEPFQYSIMTFTTKDVTVVLGPVINLHSIASKRSKRKSIQLVRPSSVRKGR